MLEFLDVVFCHDLVFQLEGWLEGVNDNCNEQIQQDLANQKLKNDEEKAVPCIATISDSIFQVIWVATDFVAHIGRLFYGHYANKNSIPAVPWCRLDQNVKTVQKVLEVGVVVDGVVEFYEAQ